MAARAANTITTTVAPPWVRSLLQGNGKIRGLCARLLKEHRFDFGKLDVDRGNTLWYCTRSSRAANTTAPAPPPPHRTAEPKPVAQHSHPAPIPPNRQPVRVLRKAGRHNTIWAPRVGVRYDGLYTVVQEEAPRQHGMIVRFKLLRRAGQRALRELRRRVPSRGQLRMKRRIRDGVAPNLEYFVDDLESQWNFVHKFDVIYARMLTGSIKELASVLRTGIRVRPSGPIMI
ncbi:hypothetical protein N0V88_007170 [Collariella sp. IMI 366227]|nr:hypothetical protein N0V88_007170 [Collariella sp. IMI 366227]